MDISKIAIGKDVPNNVNVIIENTAGADPVKYEIDKDSGALMVDRFVHTSMVYPANYGFIPNTLGGDGDPVDVLVYAQYPIVPGAVIQARPVGVLVMEDNAGQDEKIIAVPSPALSKRFDHVQNYSDLPEITVQQIQHFFEHYKDLEPGKWVKIGDWMDAENAKRLIVESIERAGN